MWIIQLIEQITLIPQCWNTTLKFLAGGNYANITLNLVHVMCRVQTRQSPSDIPRP